MLAEAASPAGRNVAFGRYSMMGGLFNAAGGLAATLATGAAGGRAFFLLYAALGVVTGGLATTWADIGNEATPKSDNARQARLPDGSFVRCVPFILFPRFAV